MTAITRCLALAFTLLCFGCASTYRIQADGTCSAQGLAKETPQYDQCVEAEIARLEVAWEEWREKMRAGIQTTAPDGKIYPLDGNERIETYTQNNMGPSYEENGLKKGFGGGPGFFGSNSGPAMPRPGVAVAPSRGRGCSCECVNGQVQAMCSSTMDIPPVCAPRVCPVAPAAASQLPSMKLPPLGTKACTRMQVYNDKTRAYEWQDVCS